MERLNSENPLILFGLWQSGNELVLIENHGFGALSSYLKNKAGILPSLRNRKKVTACGILKEAETALSWYEATINLFMYTFLTFKTLASGQIAEN
ncbi:hypothetical protein DRW07_09020 [Alteromonas sediminis]|uniref:Uncharacterized protein n=1 Tax=Alteromonas sediminis TaxID=2259342 RepID=A0A3N5Y2T4_9ALTE|nr:hypothetical protein [Alteromonas sediminis]RPJ67640.1 hypothetical protein DRW07_09020 [Alteromonas sediminis]